MIFEELVLHNFGVYKGRHTLDLRPEPGKPIILIGALNGGGKTTLLDALQLVLYGKLARCSNRGKLPYDRFLERSINRYSDVSEGAALELQLRHSTETGEEIVRVHRSWRSVGKTIRETVEVTRNGQLDPVYTEHWYEHVDEFIPSRISNLFFFDGEKIEYFADPDNAAELLRTGLHSLLGLDIVDQLGKDLDGVVQRRLASGTNDETAERLQELQNKQDELEKTQGELTNRRGEIASELQLQQNKMRKTSDIYREQGGELYEQRQTIEQILTHAKENLLESSRGLQDLSAGDAPLLLVREMIRECENQALGEHEAKKQQLLLDDLKLRDESLKEFLIKTNTPEDKIQAVCSFFRDDYVIRGKATQYPRYLESDIEIFQFCTDENLDNLSAKIQRTLEYHSILEEKATSAERKLQGVPQAAKIAELSHALTSTQKDVDNLQFRIKELDLEIARVAKNVEEVEERRRKLTGERELSEFADETSGRIVKHSERVRKTLDLYRKTLTDRHLRQLGNLILEGLQELLRKTKLLSRVHIVPETYELILTDNNGNEMHPERLSAGERQLLAVSIVWALTKSSGKPLPAIIDTPLGRLDGNHRHRLVDTYFPNASHQVLLLSTDEEIDHRHYEKLRHVTAKSYGLAYSEELQTTVISEGYPWGEVTA